MGHTCGTIYPSPFLPLLVPFRLQSSGLSISECVTDPTWPLIDYIRLSTTVATNALLERKGKKHALLITKGFKDLLLIGNQSRPRIFDLNIRRPPPLYSAVVEVDERVTLVGYTSDPKSEEHQVVFTEDGKVERGYRGKGWDGKGDAEGPGEIVRGISGEAVRILQKPGMYTTSSSPPSLRHSYGVWSADEAAIKADLEKLYAEGYRSLAVVLVHSYTYPNHELLIGRLASSVGFPQISLSSQLLPMIKMVPRGVSSTADAYLTPILREYLDGFFKGFDEKLRDGRVKSPRVEFMGSDGGLVDAERFSGLKSILSGPAGGVVGYALTSWDEKEKTPVIGWAHPRLLSNYPIFLLILIPCQVGCRRDVNGRFAVRWTVRSRVRNDNGGRDHPIPTTGYQHCRCRGRIMPHLPERPLLCRS